jgi:uncharacterized protein YndB with AHSA1/START domain
LAWVSDRLHARPQTAVQGDDLVSGELKFGFSVAPVRLPIRVTRLDPPSEIAWDCPGGFPYWEGTKVAWTLQPSEHGTKVVSDYDFGSVSLTWGLMVARLKDVIEVGGRPNPALT